MSSILSIRSVSKYTEIKKEAPEWSGEIVAKSKLPKTVPLFGIETEIRPKQSLEHDIFNRGLSFKDLNLVKEVRERMGKYVAIHNDGGVEVDSPPLTFNDANLYLEVLFGKPLKHAKAKQPANSGMHIHVSTCALSVTALERLVRFLCDRDNSEVLSKIAERSITQGGSYGFIPTLENFKKGTYTPGSYIRVKGVGKTWVKGQSDRFGLAINTRHGTHEFRLFRSTVDLVKAKANVQCVKSFVDFFKNNEGDLKSWLRFLKKNRNQYPNMYFWMKKQEIL